MHEVIPQIGYDEVGRDRGEYDDIGCGHAAAVAICAAYISYAPLSDPMGRL